MEVFDTDGSSSFAALHHADVSGFTVYVRPRGWIRHRVLKYRFRVAGCGSGKQQQQKKPFPKP